MSAQIGQRIRKYMEKRQLTIEDLAARTGLAPDFIHGLQDEDLYPSLGPLVKIARALGVRLGTFLDDQVSQDPLIIREDERRQELSMLRGRNRPVTHRFYSLGRGKTDRRMEPFFVELLPEKEDDIKLSSHEGEEFIVVQRGRVEVIYGQEIVSLGPGDSIYYNSIVPHYVGCQGSEPAAIYAVLYFPE
jgi:transcriptional regulator with XRE-family HTH domain